MHRAKPRNFPPRLMNPEKQSVNTYRVFVSSTYIDNEARRKLVADAITMAGMVWCGMELFTADVGPTVDVCLEKVKEADVLVGIIGRRYGWEPDDKISITEMEYDAATDRLMFQIHPDTPFSEKDLDPLPDRWRKQEKLEAFKARFAEDQLPAYFSDDTLQAKVLQALNEWRQQREVADHSSKQKKTTSPKKDKTSLDPLIRKYLSKAESLHENLPVAGFATQLKIPVDIADIYVPLHARMEIEGERKRIYQDACHAETIERQHTDNLEIPLNNAFREAFGQNKKGVVILGDPGSGKTTHLKRLLLWCVRQGSESLGLAKNTIPVFLPLRELRSPDKGLDVFIQDQLNSPNLQTPKNFGKKLLERGSLLLLLDGLDEVSQLSRREQVSKWITDALHSYRNCYFVVTCRFAGYSATVEFSETFLELHIRPFTGTQAESFVRNWYRIVECGLARDKEQAKEIAKQKAMDLIRRLQEPDFRARRVFELTRNPLLLTNICLVHRHRGGLPHKRARLYEECIDVLLEHWRAAKRLPVDMSAQTARRVLQPAALWMHEKEGRTRATAEELAPLIGPALKAVNVTDSNISKFLRVIRDDSGLLIGWDSESFGFMHLGFQEYLVAREIRRLAFDDEEVLKRLAGHFGQSWWQEVILLLLALEDPSLFTPFMRAVVTFPEFAIHSDFVKACIDDSAEVSTEPFLEVVQQQAGSDEALWQRQLTALRLIESLDAPVLESVMPKLKKHPSTAVQQWLRNRQTEDSLDIITAERGEYRLVKIPAGRFAMGSPTSEIGRYDDEGPAHDVEVAEFYLGVYPVTNEEYARYLKENPQVSEPEYWADRRYNQPQQPVVGVSWDDARRYAAWAGLRLPTEAEWEYACRAGTSTSYYSGDQEADLEKVGWYNKNSGEKLHAVGEKDPNGFGLYDMHGNVREWVEDDWHDNYEDAPVDGSAWTDIPRGDHRVVRGGGWFSDARLCRSACRVSCSSGIRIDYIGFRLARSVSTLDI